MDKRQRIFETSCLLLFGELLTPPIENSVHFPIKIHEHKKLGHPIFIEKKGRVLRISAGKIQIPKTDKLFLLNIDKSTI